MTDADAFLTDALAETGRGPTTSPRHPRDHCPRRSTLLRPILDRKQTSRQRVRILWAAAKNVRSFAPKETLAAEFFRLAAECGLVADLEDRRRRLSGEVTVRHVVDWGLRWNTSRRGRS